MDPNADKSSEFTNIIVKKRRVRSSEASKPRSYRWPSSWRPKRRAGCFLGLCPEISSSSRGLKSGWDPQFSLSWFPHRERRLEMCLSIWRAWTKRSAKVGLSPERDLEEASATDAEQIKVEEIGVGLGKFKVEKPNGTSCSEENPEKKVN